ncbi:MAG TPA: phage tail protein, partial [Pyrinomonadaceae bacterium]|nr:phage tail protein [Pyrinomonadaceae bacterium]
MDVNGTKFHLLLGRADWEKCKSAKGEPLRESWKAENQNGKKETEDEKSSQGFSWNEGKNEITLRERLFKFPASPKDEKPDLKNRRGAARDRYGNWYWIDETGLKIRVLSIGSNKVSDFYPTGAVDCEQKSKSDFQPIETAKQASAVSLRGLAVTIDHYLVVGMLEPKGLLIFDLFSTGEPRQILWREDVDFVPFDIAARHEGGVFVLDSKYKHYWTLDREFKAVCGKVLDSKEGEKSDNFQSLDDFQPLDETEEKRKHYQNISPDDFFSALPPDKDPISIEALPDDSVLILNLDKEDFSVIHRYYRDKKLDELSTASIKSKVKDEKKTLLSPPDKFRLRGYDIAFVEGDENQGTHDRLYVVSEEGNQAFAFSLICKNELSLSPFPELPADVVRKNFELEAINEYFPMRLYGGKGFAAAGGKVYFDFGERWLPLIKQNRPDFVTAGTLDTPVFDGKESNCVWHRLMLDGCIPPETRIKVFSRNAERKEDLEDSTLNGWREEPNLYLRGNGSELPFVENQTVKEKGKGTWEVLLQRATGRFLQLRLVFSGNGQRTPRISALRAYYPRFSYLNNYLPSIYREDEQSAFFLDRFLANFEGTYTTIEDRIAAAQMLFDVRSAPPDALDWLANWFGVVLDPNWKEDKRRLFIRHAVEFFQYRGTMRGLRIALRLMLDSCADERIFEQQTSEEKLRDPIRIVERFQTRRTPEIIPADFVEQQKLPRIGEKTPKWKPNQGADILHQRYSEKFDEDKKLEFTLIKPDEAKEAAVWEQFALETLSFVP